ncbi:hypothetical protein BJX68DRAFT_249083 [Aspergillus pseudodeflectus]|uniref:Uncharacterized protein n=1 Tax=Aspergillus pseudodeflectus TaxID=176178 RepID=A0ABR4JFI0_9EURO
MERLSRRSLRGEMSQTMVSTRTLIPLAAKPCIALPAIIMSMLLAPPQMPLPSANPLTAIMRSHRRPKVSVSCPKRG